jgi:hypothetical protein
VFGLTVNLIEDVAHGVGPSRSGVRLSEPCQRLDTAAGELDCALHPFDGLEWRCLLVDKSEPELKQEMMWIQFQPLPQRPSSGQRRSPEGRAEAGSSDQGAALFVATEQVPHELKRRRDRPAPHHDLTTCAILHRQRL